MAVKKAIVLAAGLGTRLRPLTLSRPKPLLPVMGEPMLSRILDMLVSWGVDEIKVNAHYLADEIAAFVDEYSGGESANGVRISVSREEEILGTGGVLKPLKDWIGEEPFWLVNGDIVVDELDPEPIEEAFARSGGFAACWMSSQFGPRTIEADMEGRVCNWRSDDAGFPGTYTYCGVALLSPKVADCLPEGKFSSIVEAYEKAMMTDAEFVIGVEEPDSCWCDAGTLEVYQELNSEPMAPSLFGETRLDSAVAALGWKDGETLAEYLGARGSDRIFWKLMHGRPEEAQDGETTETPDCALAVVYEEVRKENANRRFVPLTRFLSANNIRVPGILADLPEQNAYVTEFIGGKSLEELACAKNADFIRLYRPALEILCALRKTPLAGAPEMEPSFGPELFRWERELFEEQCVRGRCGMEIPSEVMAELEKVALELSAAPQVLVHRDFQSTNLICDDSGRMFVIDYQGMRLGPAEYDIASLLYDPYVPMTSSDRKLLLELSGADPRMVKLAAVQRLCQALGAFCRLEAAGQERFAKYIPKAAEILHNVAHDVGLEAFAEFSHELIHKLSGPFSRRI